MKVVSATDARARFGALVADVADGSGPVVIARYGFPRVVIVSLEEWAEVDEMRERALRQEAWHEVLELPEESGTTGDRRA